MVPDRIGPRSVVLFDCKTVRTVLRLSVSFKNVSFYARLGPNRIYTRPVYRSSRLVFAVQTCFCGPDRLKALKTTFLDCPDRPDGPKSRLFCCLDGFRSRTVYGPFAGPDCPKVVGPDRPNFIGSCRPYGIQRPLNLL